MKPATRVAFEVRALFVDTSLYPDTYSSGRFLAELRCDARWWHVDSAGKTRIITVVHITYRPNHKRLLIETWGVVDELTRCWDIEGQDWLVVSSLSSLSSLSSAWCVSCHGVGCSFSQSVEAVLVMLA